LFVWIFVNVPIREYPDTDREIGIDVGIKPFCVDSDGNGVANPAYFRASERLLRGRQRSLARKQRGSNRRSKARVLVGRAHEKIANQRRDFLDKTANHYIENYKTIRIESLNIRGMVRNRHLSKSISDSSWGKFFSILSGKAEEAGRMIVKVPPHGTSQICSNCGEKAPKSLSVRFEFNPQLSQITWVPLDSLFARCVLFDFTVEDATFFDNEFAAFNTCIDIGCFQKCKSVGSFNFSLEESGNGKEVRLNICRYTTVFLCNNGFSI